MHRIETEERAVSVSDRSHTAEQHTAGAAGPKGGDIEDRDLGGLIEDRSAFVETQRDPARGIPFARLHHVEHIGEERITSGGLVELLRDQNVGIEARYYGAEVRLAGSQIRLRILEKIPGGNLDCLRRRRHAEQYRRHRAGDEARPPSAREEGATTLSRECRVRSSFAACCRRSSDSGD